MATKHKVPKGHSRVGSIRLWTRILCIYCKEREANAREHYLPHVLGAFRTSSLFGTASARNARGHRGSLDREFSRRSPEAPIRSIHRIKGQQHGSKKKRKFAHVYQPEKIGGRHLYMYGPDPNTGRQILWQTDPARPCAVKEISQVILFDEHAEERQHIPIPTGIRTGRELVDLLETEGVTFPVPKAHVIATSGDENRVQAMCGKLNWNVAFQKRQGGRVPASFSRASTTPHISGRLRRSAFITRLRYIPTITGNEGAFRAVRDFIKDGAGDHRQFISQCEPALNPDGPSGHVLTVVATPESPLIVNMQFFAGCKTELPQ